MLDAECSFTHVPDEDAEMWGAYLGLPDEVLISGKLREFEDEIVRVRADAGAQGLDHGHLSDQALTRPCVFSVSELPKRRTGGGAALRWPHARTARVEALAQFLRDQPVGAVVGRVDVAALSVLKTFDPPITSLQGRNVTGADRFGKHLALDCDGLWLIAHLSRGGWLRWIDNPGSAPPKPGRGRWRCACTSSPPTARPPPSTSPRPAPRSGSRCGW